jgi:hypothetical protein
MNQLKDGQLKLTDLSEKKKFKWPKSTLKNAHHL